MFTVEIGTSPAVSLSCDQPVLGLLQASCFSTGFANGHYSAAPSASVGLPTIWIGVWWSREDDADGAPYHFLIILKSRRPRTDVKDDRGGSTVSEVCVDKGMW